MSARGACSSLLRANGTGLFSAIPVSRVAVHCAIPVRSRAQLISLVNVRGLNAVQRAYLSAQAGTAGSDAKASETDAKAGGEKPAGDGQKGQAADELPFEEYEMEEPFVAKASRIVWTSSKFAAGIAFLGTLVYAGYTIVVSLVPVGDSPNAIMRKATDILTHDPDVVAYYGSIKTYGLDPGGRAEGRRYFVPEYKYEDVYTGDKYHRVKFTLEGDRNRKAWVYAEVHSTTGDFRYLLVVSKDGSRVVSVVDRRPPPMSVEDRTSRVTSLLQDAGWGFYADNEVDVRQQSGVLGEYWLKVKCIRCDETPERCVEDGMATHVPGWRTTAGPSKGLKPLDELERMVQPIAKEKAGGRKGFLGLW